MLTTPENFTPLVTAAATAHSHAFVFRGNELLVRAADLALPDPRLAATLGEAGARMHPVGLLGDRYCCASWVEPHVVPPPGYAFSGLRRLFGALDEPLLAVAARAFQIAEWARTHRYCGACGAPTQLAAGERCFRCAACGHVSYPRISPAMMVLVRRGAAILLARHLASPTGRFTALAGFVEPGESIEDAVHRETFEEVGLRVQDLRYFASQSWPFPHSLMVAFTAEYAGGELAIDGNEIAEARWFGLDDEFPEIPPAVSIAHALINAHRPQRR